MSDPSAERSRSAARAPWYRPHGVREFFGALADVASGSDAAATIDPAEFGAPPPEDFVPWLDRNGVAPAAHAVLRARRPDWARLLKPLAVEAAAGNMALFDALDRIERSFERDRIDMVLLKGAAVAPFAYADPSLRPMTDLDIWVRDEDVPRASALLGEIGFRQEAGLPTRPLELQRRSGGEIPFAFPEGRRGLVELHFSAIQGWWARRTARPDVAGMWNRSEPMGTARHARRLATEDAVIQTAFHIVVNQFGQRPLRGMLDLAVIARARRPDWDVVAERAATWRLGVAIGVVLDLTDRLFGLPGAGSGIARLRPSALRRALLRAFVTPGALLEGRDLTRPMVRHPFLLALADRPRDAARLLGRALWPEDWWLAARYGRPVGRLTHLRSIARLRGV